jgi:hypothetical protein
MSKKVLIYTYLDGLEVCSGFEKLWPNNCAIRERTADGESVGPCTFYLEEGVTCPRHGKVREVKNTGERQ